MQIELLEEFVVLSVTKNFSEAAIRLNMAQPTLSRHMGILEKELGFSLLNRTRPLTLTPNGRNFLPFATEVAGSYGALKKFAQSVKGISYHELSVQDLSFSPLAHNLLSKAENTMAMMRSDIVFRHVDPKAGKSLDSLFEDGTLDIGFVQGFSKGSAIIEPIVDEHIDIVEIPRLQRKLSFIGKKSNPVLADESADLRNYEGVKFLSPTERYLDIFRDSFTRFCEKHGGFTPTFDFRETDVHRNFYAQDPGQSVFVVSHHDDLANPILPDWLSNEMRKIVFDDCLIRTYAMYRKNEASGKTKGFVDILVSQ
ncbi:LysR family transcriptional regulator [Raoultibacter timonensis]|uniref:LysR family transcriptional regulator n=1 Tax=Raoultibacter timonensis TaxID=1907662 RepID=UPI0015E18689|nr:LysR family transcriptional regulator [Raoultibacter timonensis]